MSRSESLIFRALCGIPCNFSDKSTAAHGFGGDLTARRIDCFGTWSPQRGQEALFSYVSCEARVPMGHPLRAIREIVNEAPVVLRAHGAGLALAHRRFLHTRFRGNDDS
jgi:hypothetical protein